MNITMLFWRERFGGCFVLVVVLLALLTPSSADGQWLEETIFLPDSFGGLANPRCIVYDSVDDRVLVGGWSGFVVVLDGTTGEKLGRIQVVEDVRSMCYNPRNNKVYVAGFGWKVQEPDSTITILDAASMRVVRTVRVGLAPHIVRYNARTNKVYCATGGGSSTDSVVAVIDGTSDSLVSTVGVGKWQLALECASATDKVYIGTETGLLTVLDGIADTIVAKVDIGASSISSIWCSPDGSKVLAFAEDGRDVAVIDGHADTLVGEFRLPYRYLTHDWNPTTERLYVLSTSGGGTERLLELDPFSGSTLELVMAGDSGAVVCSPAHNTVYFPHVEAGLGVYDCNTGRVRAVVPVGRDVKALAVNPSGDVVYSLNCAADAVAYVDCAADTLSAETHVGLKPRDMAYCSQGQKLYTANLENAVVTVIDAVYNRVLTHIKVPEFPSRICYNETGNKLYCCHSGSRIVSVIDCTRDMLIGTIPVGLDPCCISIDSTRGLIYVGSYLDTSVTIIDATADTVVARLKTGGARGPEMIRVNAGEGKVYACALSPAAIYVIDSETHEIARVLDTVAWPSDLCFVATNNELWILDCANGVIAVLNCTSDTYVQYIRSIVQPWDACWVEDGNKLYVQSLYREEIGVYDCATYRHLRTIEDVWPLGQSELLYNPLSRRLYGTQVPFSTYVIDTDTDSVCTVLPFGGSLSALAHSPPRNQVYAGNIGTSAVYVYQDSLRPGFADERRTPRRQPWCIPSVSSNVLLLPAQCTADMVDVTGRRVMILRPGSNDVQHLAPGVYFLRDEQGGQPQRTILVK